MAYAFNDFIKIWKFNGKTTHKPVVAFISDKYFFFDEVKLPNESLPNKEIDSMVQIAIKNFLPVEKKKILSGFFVNRSKRNVTIFAASKNRVLAEMPDLKTCTYWLPERFCRENINDKDITIKPDEKYTTIEVDQDGSLTKQDKKLNLFSENFWNAEMHENQEKSIARKVEKINSWYKKIISPLISATSVLFMLVIVLLAIRSTIGFRHSILEKRQSKIKISRIIERKKLRDEICAFTEGKALYFVRLNAINKIRPARLFFNQFTMSSPKVMQFVGTCDLIATLDDFIENLKKDSSIRVVSTPRVSSSSKETAFNLKLEYF
ncbi:MAG: hypothetical protein LBB16_04320 [Puniceicoccales bacterium]|jgi:hypothetical protein|nr:hypothetical protein [Puniceicoccales bacterium]